MILILSLFMILAFSKNKIFNLKNILKSNLLRLFLIKIHKKNLTKINYNF
jgi:hypothetical protein